MTLRISPEADELISTLELPSHAYVPGASQRHEEDFLDPVKLLAPANTLSETACANAAWLYGLRLIDEGYFWEAHEILETVWMRAAPNSRERRLLQSVIHLANAALKQRMGRPNASTRLLILARVGLREAYHEQPSNTVMGLQQNVLMEVLERLENDLAVRKLHAGPATGEI